MKAKQAKSVGELRMSAVEFDRIMGKVLQVTATSVRFIAFATSTTGVLAFECAFR